MERTLRQIVYDEMYIKNENAIKNKEYGQKNKMIFFIILVDLFFLKT